MRVTTELHRQVRIAARARTAGRISSAPFPRTPLRDLIGRQIGPYRVESQLGAGGMGEVFRAHDTKLGRDVAIKILPRVFGADPERRSRFEREARVLATLNHPHIGAIYGLEDADGVPALVLELVDGETLAAAPEEQRAGAGPRPAGRAGAWPSRSRLPRRSRPRTSRGIVHRDLKPGNVVFTADGSVKVLDFGLAKAMSDSEARAARWRDTRTGVVMGTPAYMSPEQAKGAKVDKRADIWAFGCVLFEMLTGRAAVCRRDRGRDAGRGAAPRAGLGGAARGYARRRADGPDAVSPEGPEAARARHRRRPAGVGRRVHVGCAERRRSSPAAASRAAPVAPRRSRPGGVAHRRSGHGIAMRVSRAASRRRSRGSRSAPAARPR